MPSCLYIERNRLISGSFFAINAWCASLLSRKFNRRWTLFSNPSLKTSLVCPNGERFSFIFDCRNLACSLTMCHFTQIRAANLSFIHEAKLTWNYLHASAWSSLLSGFWIADGRKENLAASRIKREIDDWLSLRRSRNLLEFNTGRAVVLLQVRNTVKQWKNQHIQTKTHRVFAAIIYL